MGDADGRAFAAKRRDALGNVGENFEWQTFVILISPDGFRDKPLRFAG
jgi:hypothetical protein